MESTQELQHWGIKGQKWGIRRYQNPDGTLTEAGKKRYYYQNPDGSLTEAGKKDYMTAAKKGKLDVSKLSDNDLNMINSRFAREKTFKQNVSDYEKSTFKYKLKEAALERIKGSGGGKGKGKGGGGGSTIGKLLAAPIAKAFADAFKPYNGSKGNGKDDDEEENRLADWKKYREYKNNGHVWTAGFKWSKADKQNRERWGKEGKRFCDDASKDWRTGDNRTSGSRTSEQYLFDNYRSTHKKTKPKPEPSVASKKWQKWDQTAERAGKSGIIISHSASARYVVTRSSDELYHWGILGQKWGVRRFQNKDGTLTAEGKERYSTGNEKHPDIDYRNGDEVSKYVIGLHKKYMDAAFNDKMRKKYDLGQDTSSEFVKNNKKYGDMVSHITAATKKALNAAIEAGNAATTSSKENWKNPGPLWENMNRKNVEYWDKFQEVADEYIQKNFSKDEQEVARSVVYWRFIDW